MDTVQHHRLQYSLPSLGHLTWMSPYDRVEADHQASAESNLKKTEAPQSWNVLDLKGSSCQIMAVNDQGVTHKVQFSADSHSKYLNSTNIPPSQLNWDPFLTKVQYMQVLSCKERKALLWDSSQ